MRRDAKKRRQRARPGSTRRKLQDWAGSNPWTWLSFTVFIAWASIFLGWSGVFYLGLMAAYATFSTGIDPERARLMVLSGFVTATVVAPLLGVTWGIKLKRELEAMKELEEYVSGANEKEKEERTMNEEKERARLGKESSDRPAGADGSS